MEYCSQPEENACADDACDHTLGVEGCALDDIEYIRQANPALERRISIEYVRNERRTLAANPLGYYRERAGRWDPPDDEATAALIKPDMWAVLEDPLSEPLDPVAFGVLGLAADEAAAELEAAGFAATIVVEAEPPPGDVARAGRAWKQSPAGGTIADETSTVTIWVNPKD